MAERFTLEQIREFWTRQSGEHGLSSAASWSDHRVIELEIREILQRLADGDRVLDVGCANGYSTVQFASQKRLTIRGLDYIPEMIDQARRRLADPALTHRLAGSVEFDVGDITALREPAGAYDKVVVIRVVINLGDWRNQQHALRECARVLRPGGMLLLSEATLQGWQRLNALRREWGLPDIAMPPFNQYLDQDRVIEAVAPELELTELANFSSTYFVATRVLKPLLAQALHAQINVADPDMEWNRWCAQLPAWGDYGTQKLFVFRKR
jgi:ubiquinone/menaquinone biosynthesis C-methylase UbiE